MKRWDYQTCTTEVGLWAGSLLRAEDALQKPRFHDLAQLGVRPDLRPDLRHGFDEASGRYWGGLN